MVAEALSGPQSWPLSPQAPIPLSWDTGGVNFNPLPQDRHHTRLTEGAQR